MKDKYQPVEQFNELTPQQKDDVILACKEGGEIWIAGLHFVPCWMCRYPVSVEPGYEHRACKAVCGDTCARDKRDHYS